MVETIKQIQFSPNEEIIYPKDNIKKSFQTEFIEINSDNCLVYQIIHSFLFYSFTSEEFLKLYNKDIIDKQSNHLIQSLNEIIQKIEKNTIIHCNNYIKLNSSKLKLLERLLKIIKFSQLKIQRDKLLK